MSYPPLWSIGRDITSWHINSFYVHALFLQYVIKLNNIVDIQVSLFWNIYVCFELFFSLHLRMLYLVDAVEGGDLLIHASKPALDFVPVTKQLYGIKWQRPSKMTLFAPDSFSMLFRVLLVCHYGVSLFHISFQQNKSFPANLLPTYFGESPSLYPSKG